jgi:hypothetical protein
MASIDISSIEGDLNTVVADAQELLNVAEKLDSLFPASEKYVSLAQNVLTVVESVLAKLK